MPDPGLVAIRLDGGAWYPPPGPDDLTRWGEEVD